MLVCMWACGVHHLGGYRLLDAEAGKVVGKSDSVHSEKIGAVACGGTLQFQMWRTARTVQHLQRSKSHVH